jgi:hypothetical protein
VPTRWVHFRIDEKLYERMRTAAAADRRSLSNWLALVVEHALIRQDEQKESASADRVPAPELTRSASHLR